MTKEEQQELVEYIMWLDFYYSSKTGKLNNSDLAMFFELGLRRNFNNATYRKQLLRKLLNLIQSETDLVDRWRAKNERC